MSQRRILVDVTHPAHVHFFRHLIHQLEAAGHRVLVTGRDKDVLVDLAHRYGLEIEVFGKARPGALALGAELLYRQSRLGRLVAKFRPSAMMAVAGTFVSAVGRVTGTPTYVFYDTEHARLSNLLAYPFATCVYVPEAYASRIRWRHERYAGYHELAYLHPRRFTPDPSVRALAGLGPEEPFSLVRFVGWQAAHDLGHKGLGDSAKRRAIEALSEHSTVLISSEGELPAELESMRLDLPVERLHDLMASAVLVFGESGTMPSEAAVLGTPGVYINPLRLGYLEEQERDYGLVFNYRPADIDRAIQKGREILASGDRESFRSAARRLTSDKIDVTDMLFRIATELPYR